MELKTLAWFLVVCTAATAQQTNFADYDYQDAFPSQPTRPPQRPQGFRTATGPTVPKPTPVPILKQINRHNDDGSYTYGYEGADGSFKIETKLATGEVMGKYGYVDDTGKLRVVDYGANKYGFQPSGEGITVAPPTFVDETKILKKGPKGETIVEYDDGSYEEPAPVPVRPIARPQKKPARPPPTQVDYAFQDYQEPQQYIAPKVRPAPRPSSQGPVPPRAVVSGAAQAGPTYRAPTPQFSQAPQQFSQAPQQYSAPAPQARPVQYRAQSAPRQPSNGILDQLANQYALPQGAGQPLHDISFGSYSSETNF